MLCLNPIGSHNANRMITGLPCFGRQKLLHHRPLLSTQRSRLTCTGGLCERAQDFPLRFFVPRFGMRGQIPHDDILQLSVRVSGMQRRCCTGWKGSILLGELADKPAKEVVRERPK